MDATKLKALLEMLQAKKAQGMEAIPGMINTAKSYGGMAGETAKAIGDSAKGLGMKGLQLAKENPGRTAALGLGGLGLGALYNAQDSDEYEELKRLAALKEREYNS
jgi:hypothetical protein